jgi:tetratricopeptide (TPR) repeat protein/predicted Ser/Thr protein kinase
VTPERWQQVDDLLQEALERGAAERDGFLRQACAGDAELEREVRSLLDSRQQAASFLEEPALEVAARALARAQDGSLPAVIGRYRIAGLLGEGGMGVVYEAVQENPHRSVALKVVRPGLAPSTLRRFEHESQALARLHHPGIAQIYEAGTADTGAGPQPFFAMEFIRGMPLREYAEAHRLSPRERLELMVKICEAVDHAHQRGVIHRDLKPGNILVEEGGPPKILDFGVARVTDNEAQVTRQTDIGQLVGTLEYMSPEQVLADPLKVDTRSDVYSLGVILYELLAGRRPYQLSRQLHEAVQTIREEDPAPLSSASRNYRGDLETIAAKALEKDKARRYGSAAGLAADIRRYLADEPILARPASATYQLRKFARRNKALVAGVAAVFVVLAAGIVASAWQAARATRERNLAIAAQQRADTEAATAKAVNDFLRNDLLAQANPIAQSGSGAKPNPDITVRIALDRAAARIAGKFDSQPLVEASIRQTIAEAYWGLGLYPESLRQSERAVELRRHILGEENRDTLESMGWVAGTLTNQGKYAEAQPIAVRILEIRRRIFGANDADTLASMETLGNIYMLSGKYAESASLLRQSADGRRRTSGENDRMRLSALNNLAVVYYRQGDQARTLAILSELVDAERRALGEDDPSTLAAINNLAILYRNLGNYAKAEEMVIQVLDARRRVLGDANPDTLVSLNTLATLYASEEKYALAEPLFREALEGRIRVRGEGDDETLGSMIGLADLYEDTSRYSEAEALYGKALAISRRVLGADHPITATALASLGRMRLRQQRYSEAKPLLQEALAIQEKRTPHAWGRYNTQSLLGAALEGQGKYEAAEPLLLSGYQGLVEEQASIPRANRSVIAQAGERIRRLYQDWGKPGEAAAWRGQARASAAPAGR